jgi:hypothetical protein
VIHDRVSYETVIHGEVFEEQVVHGEVIFESAENTGSTVTPGLVWSQP